jgi:hypothetical protein
MPNGASFRLTALTPCRNRAAINQCRRGAAAGASNASANGSTPQIGSVRRPKRSACCTAEQKKCTKGQHIGVYHPLQVAGRSTLTAEPSMKTRLEARFEEAVIVGDNRLLPPFQSRRRLPHRGESGRCYSWQALTGTAIHDNLLCSDRAIPFWPRLCKHPGRSFRCARKERWPVWDRTVEERDL